MYIDDLVISLLVLTGIRFIAFMLFLMQYVKFRSKKYLITAIGWLIYMAGPLPDIINYTPGVVDLSRFFALSAVIATFLLMMGIFLYFREIKTALLTILIIFTLIIIFLFVLIFPESIGILVLLSQGLFLISMLIFAFFNHKIVKSSRSSTSFFWLCVILFFGLFHTLGFYLFFQTAPYSIRFVFTFLINLSLLEFLIYIDLEQVQKAMSVSLREKEILLQEVHHRVRNNLMIINSLLQLQFNKVEDTETIELIKVIENRINSMALVHEQLYRSRNFKDIDFTDYINELVNNLRLSFEDKEKPVNINLDLIQSRFNLNNMIPMGMLINEIITNAYQHAFTDSGNPEIFIRLSLDVNDDYVLTIRDNGGGMVDETMFNNAKTTGFVIIDALIGQLDAKLTVKNENGTEFSILIPSLRATK